MHRCLEVSEILRAVFEALEPPVTTDSNFKLNKGPLSAASRVCKGFFEPASNVLWRSIPSFSCLIRCLPPDTLEIRGTTKFRLIRVPVEDEWSQFIKHNRRVKRLRWTTFAGATNVFKVIRMSLSASLVLPNLEIIEIASVKSGEEAYLPMFLGPSLRQVRVLYTLDSDMICAILAHIQHSSPHLRSLELSSCPLTGLLILPQFRKLEHFQLTDYTTASSAPGASPLVTIPPFSNSSALKSLKIPIPQWFTASPLDLSSLPSLTHLHLRSAIDSQSLNNLLNVNITALTCLDLQLDFDFPSEDPDFLNQVLRVISQHQNLEFLLVYIEENDLHRPIPATLELENLFPLHNLRHLEVHLLEPNLRLDLFPQLSRAWPHLEHFSVQTSYISETLSPPLEALALCATHLPNLKYLELELDATIIPEPTLIRSMNKIVIQLGFSPIAEGTWAQAAAYISSVYPHANLVHDFESDDDSDNSDDEAARHWSNVQDLLPTLASVRETERRILEETTCRPDTDVACS
ncbi:hypothetical protein PHLGIDRAFT_414715 [Phlebiopsis gigantea 11061_1 CR5-6]|uniref:F-box domain-containing protein n=1 Tax=Phlebiopsis gigantea (strain 11061_1 CR5-6) TaxID=745531 RepID=A0A0C3S8N3_PHLG1|nr:hypothetical protein PHLGIDRAFT_414715 [Phlebiopsis gigantea 11061_1 CR5-6]